MIKAILFDLDGTLVDSAPDLANTINIMRQQRKLSALEFKILRPHASHGARGLLKAGFNITPDDANYAAMRTEFLNTYDQIMLEQTDLFSGMEKIISYIETRSWHWGIVTNKPRYFSEKLLKHLNLSQRISCLVAGDDVKNAKPSAEPLLKACELLQINHSQAIYIGDAERDIQSAKNANIYSIAALYGYIAENELTQNWQANEYVNSVSDIFNKLNRL